jgi:hypothetical protein
MLLVIEGGPWYPLFVFTMCHEIFVLGIAYELSLSKLRSKVNIPEVVLMFQETRPSRRLGGSIQWSVSLFNGSCRAGFRAQA